MNIKFFIDFDGTISTMDVVDIVLERFAPREWKMIEKEWAEGKIGSRECLSRQIALVLASQQETHDLVRGIGIDPYFAAFLKQARELAVPVSVVSDGFDVFIQEILKRELSEELLKALPVYSNRLEWVGNKPTAFFNGDKICEHGCANCKPRILAQLSSKDDFKVFVGDGLSDRFAAQAADLTFAKGKLLAFCREKKIVHREYKSFHDINQWILQEKGLQ